MSRTADIDRRAALLDAPITLNGAPAKLVGLATDSGDVVAIDDPHSRASWPWETIERIVAEGGRFES